VFATKTFLAACYDFYVTTQKLTIFSKNPVILDIGANIGQFAFAVKSFYPDASLYSVEPDVDIFAILKKNFSHSKNMKLFNVAIASNNNSRTFYKSKKFSEWSTLETPKDHENYITTKVDTTTGDTLFKELLNIDLLKIDVEGAEREAIVGMSKTLSKAKYVLIEVSLQRDPIDKNTSLLLKHLLQSGFSLFRIGRIFTYASGQEQGAADLLFKNKLLKK
jgi:FkbM family methyltransferase